MELKEPTFTKQDIVKMCESQVKEMKIKLGQIHRCLKNSEDFEGMANDARKVELIMADFAIRLKLLEEYMEERQ
jgi:hypothetical protein